MPPSLQSDHVVEALALPCNPRELDEKNAQARPVPRHYCGPEMDALHPWQRAIVFDEARKRLRKRRWFIGAMVGWLALSTAVWQFGFGGRTAGGEGLVYVLFTLLPQMILFNLATRHEMRSLAQAVRQRIAVRAGEATA